MTAITLRNTMTLLCRLFLLSVVLAGLLGCDSGGDENDLRVLIIGVDGMSPDGVSNAETPNLDKLMRDGASTMHARAVLGTSSSQNWASMIMGAGPEQHGITSNAWELDDYTLEPTDRGLGPIFPAIFDLVIDQKPGSKVASVYDWSGFGRLYNKEGVTIDIDANGPVETAERTAEVLATQRPLVTFVQLDHVDHAGHEYGHGTAEYYQSVEEADRLVGIMIDALEEAGTVENTVILVTSDHGGIDKGHGGETMDELEIPWILAGPGIAEGVVINDAVNTFDTAASAAYVLGLDVPVSWIGRPPRSAFKNFESAEPVQSPAEIDHVLVVGVDGMSPDGVQKAHTPAMNRLIRNGAYSFHARALMPTSSSPNWASMMMGAGPEQHGITSNDWRRDNYSIKPTGVDSEGLFPTMFSVLKTVQPDARVVVSYDWGGFGRLFSKSSVDVDINADGPVAAADSAVAHFAEKPVITFVQLDHVDGAGHGHGYHSDEYYEAVGQADRLIGSMVDGLEAAGMLDRTLVIVTSDHGGIGTGHGGSTMDEMEIPWIVSGPGVTAGKRIDEPIDTYDTAATVLYALGIAPPDVWIGRPVTAAFAGAGGVVPYIPAPKVSPSGGLFIGEQPTLSMSVDHEDAEIRYSLTGKPSPDSDLYTTEIKAESDVTLCARAFVDGEAGSVTCESYEILPAGVSYGLDYGVYEGSWDTLPDLSGMTPSATGHTLYLDLDRLSGVPEDYYVVQFDGTLAIETAGLYEFELKSDDGSRLTIGNQVVVDNPGHGTTTAQGSIDLSQGNHHITIGYLETYGDNRLLVHMSGPELEAGPIPVRMLHAK